MATVAVPQHMTALARANEVRLAAAAVKRQVAAGTLTIGEALEHPDAGSLVVMDLLVAQHRWGGSKAARLMAEARISQVRRVRELTARQRGEISERVG